MSRSDIPDFLRNQENLKSETKGEMMEWQLIETAPKDCRILIGRVGHPWVFLAWWHERYNHWATGAGPIDFLSDPTHWMPSPDAPSQRTPHPSLTQTS